MFDCTGARKEHPSGAARSWRQDGGDQERAQADYAAEFQDHRYLMERERKQARRQSSPETHEGEIKNMTANILDRYIEEECHQPRKARPMRNLGREAECSKASFRAEVEKGRDYHGSRLVTDVAVNADVDAQRLEEISVVAGAVEAVTLAEVLAVTAQLKQQIFQLQGDASEQKDRLASMDQLQDQVVRLQGEVLELQKQLAFGTPVQWQCDAAMQDHSVLEATAVPLSSPRHRLGQMFNRPFSPGGMQLSTPVRSASPERRSGPSHILGQVFGSSPTRSRSRDANGTQPHSPTPSRSPTRSNSPSRRLCQMVSNSISNSISRDLGMMTGTHSPFRCMSPERSDSPTRRIVARLAPSLLSTITGCVDGQIQRLESRLVSMEKSVEKKQSAPQEPSVDGAPKYALQTLVGRDTFQVSRTSSAHDLEKLLALSVEDLQSSTPCKELNMTRQQGCQITPGKKASSWKRFFRRPKLES